MVSRAGENVSQLKLSDIAGGMQKCSVTLGRSTAAFHRVEQTSVKWPSTHFCRFFLEKWKCIVHTKFLHECNSIHDPPKLGTNVLQWVKGWKTHGTFLWRNATYQYQSDALLMRNNLKLKNICWMKEASLKRLHILGFHVYSVGGKAKLQGWETDGQETNIRRWGRVWPQRRGRRLFLEEMKLFFVLTVVVGLHSSVQVLKLLTTHVYKGTFTVRILKLKNS